MKTITGNWTWQLFYKIRFQYTVISFLFSMWVCAVAPRAVNKLNENASAAHEFRNNNFDFNCRYEWTNERIHVCCLLLTAAVAAYCYSMGRRDWNLNIAWIIWWMEFKRKRNFLFKNIKLCRVARRVFWNEIASNLYSPILYSNVNLIIMCFLF